jgi:hypothetical protein
MLDDNCFKLHATMSELCNDTVCQTEDGKMLKGSLERSCEKCGISLLQFCDVELSMSEDS